jgi:hypothetical protein
MLAQMQTCKLKNKHVICAEVCSCRAMPVANRPSTVLCCSVQTLLICHLCSSACPWQAYYCETHCAYQMNSAQQCCSCVRRDPGWCLMDRSPALERSRGAESGSSTSSETLSFVVYCMRSPMVKSLEAVEGSSTPIKGSGYWANSACIHTEQTIHAYHLPNCASLTAGHGWHHHMLTVQG